MTKFKLPAVLAFLVLLSGCGSTPAQRLYRAELLVGAAADSVALAADAGKLKDDDAKVAKAVLIAVKDTMVKVRAAYAADDKFGFDFWLDRLTVLLTELEGAK